MPPSRSRRPGVSRRPDWALCSSRYLTLTLGEGRSRSDDRIEYDATFMAGYHDRTIRDRLGEVRTSGEVSLSAIC
jgi:hypothetical protein